jgi:hypothetical protein
MKRIAAFVCFCLPALPAQPPVAPENRYERILCVVPLIGNGTWEDPKRPMYAPLPSEMGRGKSGILAYYHEPTDDGTLAIVQFVVADHSALQALRTSFGPLVKVLDPKKDKQSDMEATLKALQKNFDIKRFALRVP